mgnify:FL=1
MDLQNQKQKRKRGLQVGVRRTEETIVNGVKEIKRVPNVPNMSTTHPLYRPPVSNLGQLQPEVKTKK